MHFLSNEFCTIDAESFEAVIQTQGVFFEKIALIGREKVAQDLLNPIKAINQASILQRYCDLAGKKVLEVGSGLGINHIVWTKRYKVDGYGIEPSEEGFDSSYEISKRLIEKNGLDPSRIIDAHGEAIPFPSYSFDVVYSTNVLEHTHDPEAVIRDAFRVLRVNGTLQFVYPNYHSYFDGHYAVFHPPIFSSKFFPWYVKKLYGRDPDFAWTLRTELNIPWTKAVLDRLRITNDFTLLSMGKEVFLERMNSVNFDAWAGLTKVAGVLNVLGRLGLNRMAAKTITLFNGINPIILTLRKSR